MIKNKKDLLGIITFTVVLIFSFIYIVPIWQFVEYIFKLFMPFILGLVIAFVLNVLMSAIENKWLKKAFKSVNNKVRRTISLILSLTIVLGLFIFIGKLVIPELQNTIEIFSDNIEVYQENLNNFLEKFGVTLGKENILNTFVDNIGDYIKDNGDNVINITIGVASNVVTTVVNLTIAIVFAIYFLVQKEKLTGQFNKLMKAYLPSKAIKKIEDIAKISNKTFANFVSGQCLEAVIIGVLCLLGMLILRLPYAPTISVLVGFTALIPVFGALIGTVIGAFLIFMLNPIEAIIFVIFIFVLQQLEGNLIYPKVVGKVVNLPSIWVLVAVTLGASINGVVGMLLSVPLCSICYGILVTNVHSRLKNK